MNEDAQAGKVDSTEGSDSDSDEDWMVPRPKQSAKVKIRASPSSGKQRGQMKAGVISSVDDAKRTVVVDFTDGSRQEMTWRQADKDLTFESKGDQKRMDFDQIDHAKLESRDRKALLRSLSRFFSFDLKLRPLFSAWKSYHEGVLAEKRAQAPGGAAGHEKEQEAADSRAMPPPPPPAPKPDAWAKRAKQTVSLQQCSAV